MTEKDVEQVAEFLHRVVQISLTTQKEAGSKLLKDFTKTFESGSGEAPKLIAELKKDVMKFATSFPLPGIPDTVSQALYDNDDTIRADFQTKIVRPEGVDL
jgi:glycine hydroxymethyltransferase